MSGMHVATSDLTSTRVALSTSSIHLATSRRSYLASTFVPAVTNEAYLVQSLFISHSATVALLCQPFSTISFPTTCPILFRPVQEVAVAII